MDTQAAAQVANQVANQAVMQAELIVQSFDYTARQLAGSAACGVPAEQYAQLHGAAEKHCSALNLLLRDATQRAQSRLRNQSVSRAESQRACAAAAQTIVKAQQAIANILARYATQRLAA